MQRKRIHVNVSDFPDIFRPLLAGYPVFDSSCSPNARVYYIAGDGGYYLKCSHKGSLEKEAKLTRFFHEHGLAAEVLTYESLDKDYLLTAAIPGEDCIHPMYLDDPVRLCDTTAQLLRTLHDTPADGCPVCRTEDYIKTAERNYRNKAYDMTLFPDNWGYSSPEAAWEVIQKYAGCLKSDTLLHGDYCLPNILLDNWQFRGFVDMDTGGIGDRHIDLFWGVWSLQFNLKTGRYRERFLDAYGRKDVEEEMFRVIAAFEVFE